MNLFCGRSSTIEQMVHQPSDGGLTPTRPLQIIAIAPKIASEFIKNNHYSHRSANTAFAFGLFEDGVLVGAVTFGRPSSPQVARSVSPMHTELVWELNRLALITPTKNAASMLIGHALRKLPKPYICVSFADRGQQHVGFVYQATNFWFAGESRPHDSEYLIDGKRVHPRTLASRGITAPRQWAKDNNIKFVPIEPKYRYVIFKGVAEDSIKWPLSKTYPKGNPILLNARSKTSHGREEQAT